MAISCLDGGMTCQSHLLAWTITDEPMNKHIHVSTKMYVGYVEKDTLRNFLSSKIIE